MVNEGVGGAWKEGRDYRECAELMKWVGLWARSMGRGVGRQSEQLMRWEEL